MQHPSSTRRYGGDSGDDDETRSLTIEPTQVGSPPAVKAPTAQSFVMPTPGGDPYIGTIISERYRVLRKLGEGGMGVVYLAEHIVIEKKVALKILSDDFARKADLVARFMQEAKAASRIGHENIVDITDFGQTAGGSVFFAMEHLEGSDLAGVIRDDGPMPFSRVLPIVQQICRALGAAHGKGIIHRDMKPENIFIITRNGTPDFVKILDFGIAKMSAIDEPSERLTRTGMIFGTPEYMSPEQARGDRPDHRVDIYALGCIMYEMLTGDVPFHAETFMGVLTKHMFEKPEALGMRVAVPPDVEEVVMKALAKSRDERFQSMRELAVALTACTGTDSPSWSSDVSGQIPAPSSLLRATPKPLPAAALPPRPKQRASLPYWVGGAVVLVGVVGFLALRPTHAPVDVPSPVVQKPVIAPVLEKPTPPPSVVRHSIAITTTPPGPGELYNGDVLLGTLPGAFKLDHSTDALRLTAKRKGFASRVFLVTPDRDQTIPLSLEALPRKSAVVPPKKVTRVEPQVAVHTPEPTPPPKIDPVVPKPKKVERHDLMDPFPTAQ